MVAITDASISIQQKERANIRVNLVQKDLAIVLDNQQTHQENFLERSGSGTKCYLIHLIIKKSYLERFEKEFKETLKFCYGKIGLLEMRNLKIKVMVQQTRLEENIVYERSTLQHSVGVDLKELEIRGRIEIKNEIADVLAHVEYYRFPKHSTPCYVF